MILRFLWRPIVAGVLAIACSSNQPTATSFGPSVKADTSQKADTGRTAGADTGQKADTTQNVDTTQTVDTTQKVDTTETVDPTPEVDTTPTTQADTSLQVFLLAGQSNMAGRGVVEAQDRVVNPRVRRLDESMEWVPAVDPLHWDKPAIVGVGPGRSFGLVLAARDPDARIGLVPAAVGGSPISSWQPGARDPGTGTFPYDDALARMRVAMRDGKVRAILWHQGESDASPELSVVYEAKLRALIARFRGDLDQPDLPFIVGQLGQFDGKPWSADVQRVDAAHRAVAASVPNVAYVSSDGLRDKGDGLHFDAASARLLGARYAAAYLAMIK